MKTILIQTGAIAAFALFAELGASAAKLHHHRPVDHRANPGLRRRADRHDHRHRIADRQRRHERGHHHRQQRDVDQPWHARTNRHGPGDPRQHRRHRPDDHQRQQHQFERADPVGRWRRDPDEQVARQRHLEQLWRDDVAERLGWRLAGRRFQRHPLGRQHGQQLRRRRHAGLRSGRGAARRQRRRLQRRHDQIARQPPAAAATASTRKTTAACKSPTTPAA